MKKITFLLLLIAFTCQQATAQDTLGGRLKELQSQLNEYEKTRLADSVRKALLNEQILLLGNRDKQRKEQLEREIKQLESADSARNARLSMQAARLREEASRYPVLLRGDTLFMIYNRSGATKPAERAKDISTRLRLLTRDDFLTTDSILVLESDYTSDIVYRDQVIMSISDLDARIYNQNRHEMAAEYAERIRVAVADARKDASLGRLLTRIGLVVLILAGVWLLIRLTMRLHRKSEQYISTNKEKWLKNLSYKDYTFLSADQELKLILFILKFLKWVIAALILYLNIPLIFSIFPFTRGWADKLFGLIWSPFSSVLQAVWDYIPNLFSILVIVVLMRYFIKFVRYIFTEIESEKLRIPGFHADWAPPTYSIVKFLLYAFMFVMIFPYLPGSDSGIFKGVSVFIGVLFSLGSSSAIANIIAGIVITYMRPFKIGDRIKIGEMTGDVIEKTLLVTRLKTPKMEEITIPNASVLSGNTINYSANAGREGLIVHTTVTIGYDIPWKDVHQALIDAALRTPDINREPLPFVLQTSLDDFYVSYQLNAHIGAVNRIAAIYSALHQNIQDVFNEKGFEIMSPHYRAMRDGGETTIPAQYSGKE
ncbi:MAG TPA: mechanosensitive ion channel [Lentimicrobium sp.]|jgi:small-conductance mechanosensitive channel|nr:mechanosensitive ion channel [Lentimicrobium sp.]